MTEVKLDLTREEAAFLQTILARISGDPVMSARKHARSIQDKLLLEELQDSMAWPLIWVGWQNSYGTIHFDN